MVTAQDIERKQEIKPYLANRFHVSKIGYFGSFAEDRLKKMRDVIPEFREVKRSEISGISLLQR